MLTVLQETLSHFSVSMVVFLKFTNIIPALHSLPLQKRDNIYLKLSYIGGVRLTYLSLVGVGYPTSSFSSIDGDQLFAEIVPTTPLIMTLFHEGKPVIDVAGAIRVSRQAVYGHAGSTSHSNHKPSVI